MRWSTMFFTIICMMLTGFGVQLLFAPHNVFRATPLVPLSQSFNSSLSHPKAVKNKCKPVQNVAFVKTHKTGSTTLKTIINRFGYTRNLSFVLYENSSTGHFNYQKIVIDGNKTNILPPLGVMFGDYDHYRGYNISNVHLVYNRLVYRQLMHPKSMYISILREPSSQWLSAFQYFRVYEMLKTKFANKTEAVIEFMKFPGKYKTKNSYAWNNQLLDLGLGKVHFSNKTMIMEYVKQLAKNLDLVLITEYFDESLILLKKLFCWDIEDILYVKQRQQESHILVSDHLRRKILYFNRGDDLLYNFFNKTFWEKVRQYGPSFEDDLREFRTRLKDLEKDCIGEKVSKPADDGRIYIQYNKKQGAKEVICDMLVNRDFHMEELIEKRQRRTNSRNTTQKISSLENTQFSTSNSTSHLHNTEIN